MALAAGIASSFGMGTESVVGTYFAPDHFFEYLPGENINYTRKRIFSKAIRNGRRVAARWAPTTAEIGGDITVEAPNRGMAYLLKHCLGTVVSSTGTARNFADGVTNSTILLTSVTAAFVAGDVGAVVSGPGIPPGTKIAVVTNGTNVNLSQSATASASGLAIGLGIGHTITPGDLSGLSFTAQVPRPDVTGTKRIFSYLGCKVDKWALSAKVNEYAMFKLSIYGINEDLTQSISAPSYSATYSPYVYTSGQLIVGGAAVDVMEFTLQGDNTVAKGRHFLRATTPHLPKEALENGIRPISGNIKVDFTDLTLYNNYVNGVESSLVLVFQAAPSLQSGATNTLAITCNVEWDGDTPNVAGEGLLNLQQPFTVVSATSDAAAITAVVGTSEVTP